MELAGRTWTEVAESPPTIVLIPVGSLEQHGPHAPLGTDRIIAEEVAKRGDQATAIDVDIGPTIEVGVSAEHRHFAGSLWVSPDVFRAYVEEVASSVSSHDIEGIIFVNGHGGNINALEEVAATVTRKCSCLVASFTWFAALTDPPFPMGHGGPLETSALLAIDANLVHEDRLEQAGEKASDRWGDWVGNTNLAVDVDTFSANGVVGDPREASQATGEHLLAESGSALAEVIEGVAQRIG